MRVEPSKVAQLVIAYQEKFGRHVPLYERRIEAWGAVGSAKLGMDPAEGQSLKSLIATGPQPRHE